MNLVIGNSLTKCFCDNPDSAVIYHFQLLQKSCFIQMAEIIGHKAVYMLLQRTDGFHKTALEIITDTHNLTGCLHLCGQGSLCTDEFIKRKTRHLDNAVVQHRLEACHGLSGNGIFNLIQRITNGDLCSSLIMFSAEVRSI